MPHNPVTADIIDLSMKGLIKRFPRSLVFPAGLVVFLSILSILQISGTSMGVYDYMFGGSKENIYVGQPRSVRSDEWAVTTPFTIAQSISGYPVNNSDVGSGQDMTVVVDVPYLDWSTLFKPQNLSFFIAPLEVAFAFKWWYLAAVLAISVYVFILLLYPKKYLLASLLSVFFVFNPFIQWWYQSITLLPIAYALLAVVVFFKLIHAKRIRFAALYGVLLSYILICFALLMYPAFQISVLLAVGAIAIAILIARKEFHLIIKRHTLIILGVVALSVLGVVAVFILQHLDVIRTTLSTTYPGGRNIESGGFNPILFATWPMSYLLLDQETQGVFNSNQSETSNFLLVGLAALPFVWILWFAGRKRSKAAFKLSKTEITIVAAASVVILIIFMRMFIPFGDFIFSLLGLSKVPHVRLLIAIGIINLVLLAVLVGRTGKKIKSWKEVFDKYHLILLGVMFVAYGTVIYGVKHHYVIEFMGWKEISALTAALSVTTTLLLSTYKELRYASLIFLCLFAVGSSGLANPLYKGLSIENNPMTEYVKLTEAKDDHYWISNDAPYLSSVILASGAELYGGVNTYPQLSTWEKFFPNDTDTFNRYAHIRFKIDNSLAAPVLSLVQADSFRITLPSCSPLLKELNIHYIVSDENLGDSLPCYPRYEPKTFNQKNIYTYSR